MVPHLDLLQTFKSSVAEMLIENEVLIPIQVTHFVWLSDFQLIILRYPKSFHQKFNACDILEICTVLVTYTWISWQPSSQQGYSLKKLDGVRKRKKIVGSNFIYPQLYVNKVSIHQNTLSVSFKLFCWQWVMSRECKF